MVVDKDDVTGALRARGDHDRALQAETTLPRTVDLERDGALLQHQLDLTVSDLEDAVGKDEPSAEEPEPTA